MIYITLAIIPPRIHFLSKVIDCLSSQTVLPDKIIVNACKHYDRFQVTDEFFEILEKLGENPLIDIVWTNDNGAATKLYGFFEKFCDKIEENDKIIIVDDDILYHKDTVKSLTNYHSDVVSFNYMTHILKKDDSTHPVRPNLPGYLGYCFLGKYAKELFEFMKECLTEFPITKFEDDAIVTRFMRKNKASILWVPGLEFKLDKYHEEEYALWRQKDCENVRENVLMYLCQK